MITKIYFTKMHALGNDFIILEAVTQVLSVDKKLARALADRHFGIGCDQVLLLEPPRHSQEDFFYRIFNADGQEVNQCGNGARCIGRFILEKGLSQKKALVLGTHQGPLRIAFNSPDIVTVFLPSPSFDPKTIPMHKEAPESFEPGHYEIPFGTEVKAATVLSIGNPHCVFLIADIQAIDLQLIALNIESSGLFPEGVNVEIMQVVARNHIKLRVFERGAGETLACGSGACAAVIAGIWQKVLSSDVKVDMPGGSVLVSWPDLKGPVALSGATTSVFDGFFVLQNQPNFSLLLQKHSI